MSLISVSQCLKPDGPWDTDGCLEGTYYRLCNVTEFGLGVPGPQMILKDFLLHCDAPGDTTLTVEGVIVDVDTVFYYPDPAYCTIHQIGATISPVIETECPVIETECPEDPTNCPLVDTDCPVDPINCPAVDTCHLNKLGSILVYPLIDNINYRTIIEITNLAKTDV